MKTSVNPIDKYVGSRVQLRRELLGMRETKLAEAIGVTTDQLQKYENGAVRIIAEQLLKITKTLQVSPAFFFDGFADCIGGKRARADAA